MAKSLKLYFMNDKIFKILETAIHAPSGDNSQPWEFDVSDSVLKVYNVIGKDNKIFNYKERGSLFAHGALIENINILATQQSLSADIVLLPDPNEPSLIAKISFTNDLTVEFDPLAYYIEKRHTNRKAFNDTKLTETQKEIFLKFCLDRGVKVGFIEDPKNKEIIAKAASNTERIMLQHKPLHDLFFSFIRWTREEELQNPGLFLKTMELAPPKQIVFKLYRNWKLAILFNFLGLPNVISSENALVYQKCAAFGLLSSSNSNPESFIKAGRAFQRIWLQATTYNLSIQPVSAILYLDARIKEEGRGDFSEKFSEDISKASLEITQSFHITNETPIMLFRIGFSSEPTAVSSHVKPRLKLK